MTLLKTRITEDMKEAMKAKDQRRLTTIRLITAAIKQKEIDERPKGITELDDNQVIAVLEKMLKQRQESLNQYQEFNRADLAEQEAFEIGIIENYMPAQMSETDIAQFVDKAIEAVGASGPQDMGKIMAYIKKEASGRIDMGVVSQKVKERLA
jgi:uncharacterized protein YqeY